jgi:hypothetical protein
MRIRSGRPWIGYRSGSDKMMLIRPDLIFFSSILLPECNSRLLDENPVVPGNGLVKVGDEGILEAAQPALLAGQVDPGQVREVGVSGHTQHLQPRYFWKLDPDPN